VINVGSLSGAIPISLLSTYSASKSFMATWSAALREELKDEDIDVVHLNAFYVVSEIVYFNAKIDLRIRKPNFPIPRSP
jgi:17beta-estradiol 17-dehydrogenase / very-long-chain 3-oxoacyl-CoA reductase